MASALHVGRTMKTIDIDGLATVVGAVNLKSAVERGLAYGATGTVLGTHAGVAVGTGVGLLTGVAPTPATVVAGAKIGAAAGFAGGFVTGFARDLYENRRK